jgi:hypothetical protein
MRLRRYLARIKNQNETARNVRIAEEMIFLEQNMRMAAAMPSLYKATKIVGLTAKLGPHPIAAPAGHVGIPEPFRVPLLLARGFV